MTLTFYPRCERCGYAFDPGREHECRKKNVIGRVVIYEGKSKPRVDAYEFEDWELEAMQEESEDD